MREPIGECQPGTYERRQVDMTVRPRTNKNELVTNVNDDLTDNMIDGHQHNSQDILILVSDFIVLSRFPSVRAQRIAIECCDHLHLA